VRAGTFTRLSRILHPFSAITPGLMPNRFVHHLTEAWATTPLPLRTLRVDTVAACSTTPPHDQTVKSVRVALVRTRAPRNCNKRIVPAFARTIGATYTGCTTLVWTVEVTDAARPLAGIIPRKGFDRAGRHGLTFRLYRYRVMVCRIERLLTRSPASDYASARCSCVPPRRTIKGFPICRIIITDGH